MVAIETQRPNRAIELLEQALAEYGDDPRQAQHRAAALTNLGRAYLSIGNIDQAEGLLRTALELQEASIGPDHPDVAVTLRHLASAALAQGLKRQSKAFAKRAAAIRALTDQSNAAGVTIDASVWLQRSQ